MAFQLTEQGVSLLRERLSVAVADPVRGIAGAAVCVVNKAGELIFSEADGVDGSVDSDPVTLNSLFWLASCSKLILSIACMQLVEQGILELDNPDQLEELLPKLKSSKVLEQTTNGRHVYTEKVRRITLRMLLNHTAGFHYSSFSPKLNDWILSDTGSTSYFEQPLMSQPGEDWNYGSNNEWISLLVEIASGERMQDYVTNHIFEPLGLKNITLFPATAIGHTALKMNHRSLKDGTLQTGPHFMHHMLDVRSEAQKDKSFQNGAGCFFAQPTEYCQIIATILNNGTSPTTAKQILKSTTVDAMHENQIPHLPNFAREHITPAIPEETYPITEYYPAQPHHQPQGWGLSFMLTLEPTPQGRGPFTACWSGMANLYWWADRHKGVGGFIGTQIVPFADPIVIQLAGDVETIVYSNQTGVKST